MRFEPGMAHRVALKCSRCKKWWAFWELDRFIKALGDEYKTIGYVMQSCVVCGLPSKIKHEVVGLVTERKVLITSEYASDLMEGCYGTTSS
jgi:hypothetical protein